jgi:hypothetical protein
MAIDANARLNTITYPGGTVTAQRGLLTYVFGDLSTALRWEAPGSAVNPNTGRRRRLYGTKQRGSSRAGEGLQLKLDNGSVYTVRVTGTHLNFIQFMLGRMRTGKVMEVTSERGTIYGPQARNNV